MGLQGYRLWVIGQLDSNVQSPTACLEHADDLLWGQGGVGDDEHRLLRPAQPLHGVALQVAFERRILKPVFRLIGYRLWV
jgi:hypothetical protein